MDKLVYIYYPLLVVLLFAGARLMKKGEWNDEVLSFDRTKAFLGFAALVIIFHHLSHKTCASWLKPFVIRHGFDAFVYLGYLCVAVFFFCSGYGMYTSSRKKEGFFDSYLRRRILPIFCPALVMWLVFFITQKIRKVHIDKPFIINVDPHEWYIPAILYCYVFFLICFHLIKNEKRGMALLWVSAVAYIAAMVLMGFGTWWYNTILLFPVGVNFARNYEKRMGRLKEKYPLRILISLLITAAAFTAANYYPYMVLNAGKPYNPKVHALLEGPGQMISACFFVYLMLLLGMKIKIGNRVLAFLGWCTLEIYLVHTYFVEIFAYAFMNPGTRAVFFIKDPFLYGLAVLVPSIPLAWGLKKAVNACLRLKK